MVNESGRWVAYQAAITFHGQRPILSKDIDLDFLNDWLDLYINQQQPFQLAFENEAATVEVWIAGRKVAVPVTRSFVRLRVREDWRTLHPGMSDLSYNLGAHIFDEGTASDSITLTAVIHDGMPALRVRISFPRYRGKINVIEAFQRVAPGWADAIGDIADIGIEPQIIIDGLGVDFFFVLQAGPRPGHPHPAPAVEAFVRPRLDLRPSYGQYIVTALLHLIVEEGLPEAAGDELKQAGGTVLAWLLGDRGREVTGSTERLSLQYAGDAPQAPLFTLDDRFPSPPSTALVPGNLGKIDHIVVVMMENRSFDHMLGYLSLPAKGNDGRRGAGRGDVEGLKGNETNPVSIRGGARQRVFSLATPRVGPTPQRETRGTRFPFDPGHSFTATKAQRGGWSIELPRLPLGPRPRFSVGPNEGFVLDFARVLANEASAQEALLLRGEIMGYHPAEHVPVYDFLAKQYAVCDHWFAAHPGHTWPNRFVTLTGRLAPGPNGYPQVDNPDMATFDPLEIPTIFDHLSKARVSWRYYEHEFSMIRTFSRYTFDRDNVVHIDHPSEGFFARAASGTLPSVTFVDPDMSTVPPANDDHPPADVRDGQIFIKRVYNALKNSPKWTKTLLVIAYDEHGGFYDHVHPASQPLIDPANPTAGGFVPLALDPATGEPVDHYGMRVPALVVSPWIPSATVLRTPLDHTAILKTIMARFLSAKPPNMGWRVWHSPDLGALLTLPQPQLLAQTDPVIRRVTPPPFVLPDRRHPDDFREFLRVFGQRVRRG